MTLHAKNTVKKKMEVKDDDKMPGTLGEKKKRKRLQKPNWCWVRGGGVELATYTHKLHGGCC